MTDLSPGAQAPDFTLATDEGEVSLAGLKGQKVVVYFYPKDDTSGCTVEAQDFTRLLPEFKKAGTTVIGVSRDSVKSHARFRAKYELAHTLASDESLDMLTAYGVWQEKSMYGRKYMGINRDTVLIGADGRIIQVWHKVKVTGHVEEVLNAVRAA